MKKATHEKKDHRKNARIRISAVVAVCFAAIVAIGLAICIPKGSSPTSAEAPHQGGASAQEQNHAEGTQGESQIPNLAKDVTTVSVDNAHRISVENPSFSAYENYETVSDEGMAPHQAGVALAMVPKGTTRDQLHGMLADASYVDASGVTDNQLEMGLVTLAVADGVALSDAIDALERIPGIDGAQPNFVYTLADSSSATVNAFAYEEEGEKLAAAENENAKQNTSIPATESAVSSGSPTSLQTVAPNSDATAPDDVAKAEQGTISAESEKSPPINDTFALGKPDKTGYWQLVSTNIFSAWEYLGFKTESDENSVGIAIIDTGANTAHVDLSDRIVATHNSTNSSTDVTDVLGHGTHVAGIAAASTNNNQGIAGAAYNSDLVIIKASTGDTEEFDTARIADGYNWLMGDPDGNGKTVAQEHNVKIINLSIGGQVSAGAWDIALCNAITAAKQAGILTVAAAGNASGKSPVPYTGFPSDYSDVLSVINLQYATPSSEHPANDASGCFYVSRNSGSNYNEEVSTEHSQYTKDISAPGTGIWSAHSSGSDGSVTQYGLRSGTSMAAPLVAGIAALIYEADGMAGNNSSVDDIVEVIESTATDIEVTGWDAETGYGEINAGAAVESIITSRINGSSVVSTSQAPGSEVYSLSGDASGSSWVWESSNTDVATIDPATGALTALSAGETIISASSGNLRSAKSITVIDPSITYTTLASDLEYVWSKDSAEYAIDGEGADGYSWTWSIENSSFTSEAVSIGKNSGVLVTNVADLSAGTSIDIVARCASYPNITVRKTITIKPEPTIKGSSQIYRGLKSSYVIPGTSSSDWTWSVSGDGTSVSVQSTGSVVVASSEETNGTITLTAQQDDKTISCDIEVIEPAIVGNDSIQLNNSTVYALDTYIAGSLYTWSATIKGVAADPAVISVVAAGDGKTATVTSKAKSDGPVQIAVTIFDAFGTYIEIEKSVALPSTTFNEDTATVLFPSLSQDEHGSYFTQYDGSAKQPIPQVFIGSTELVYNTDFTVSYNDADYVNAGTHTVTIVGINGYSGTFDTEFTISQQDISSAVNSVGIAPFTYSGFRIEPEAPELIFNGATVSRDDYTVSYGTNTDAGIGTVIYTGQRNFSGLKTVQFIINPESIAKPFAKSNLVYNGSEQTGIPSGNGYTVDNGSATDAGSYVAKVTLKDTANYCWSDGTTKPLDLDWSIKRKSIEVPKVGDLFYTGELQTGVPQGEGYTVRNGSAKQVGEYLASVTPISNYEWSDTGDTKSRSIKYTIARRPLSGASVSGTYTYTGSAFRPSVNVEASGASVAPTYSVKYEKNTDAGTAEVTVRGTGNFCGEQKCTFTINPAPITRPSTTGGLVYNGSLQTGVAAREYCSIWDNTAVDAGTHTAHAQPDANHCWDTGGRNTLSINFTIAPRDISQANIEVADQSWTGTACTPSPTVSINGTGLSNGKDFTLAYSNNVNAGTAQLTVTGIGNYTGSKTQSFSITQQTTEMYRLYNPNSGEHFYTASAGERDMLVSVGWSYEGVGWIAPRSSSVPVFRLYNGNAGDHHYTMSEGERDMLVSVGWSDEGIGWYSDESQGVPLYRQYNPNATAGSHNYTTSIGENDMLVSIGWHAEGIGWYGVG